MKHIISIFILVFFIACGGEDIPFDVSLLDDTDENLSQICACQLLDRVILTQECFDFCTTQEAENTDNEAPPEDENADEDVEGEDTDSDVTDTDTDTEATDDEIEPTDLGDETNVPE